MCNFNWEKKYIVYFMFKKIYKYNKYNCNLNKFNKIKMPKGVLRAIKR